MKRKRGDLHETQSGNFSLSPFSFRWQIYELITLLLFFQRKTSAASPAGDRMLSGALCLDGELSSRLNLFDFHLPIVYLFDCKTESCLVKYSVDPSIEREKLNALSIL